MQVLLVNLKYILGKINNSKQHLGSEVEITEKTGYPDFVISTL